MESDQRCLKAEGPDHLALLLEKMEDEPLRASSQLKKDLFLVLEQALKAFLAMRAKEGAHLAKILKGYVQDISSLLKKSKSKRLSSKTATARRFKAASPSSLLPSKKSGFSKR